MGPPREGTRRGAGVYVRFRRDQLVERTVQSRSYRRGHGFDARDVIDQGHDVVTISPVVDSCYPRWIGRAGKGDERKQDERHDDGEKRRD